MIPPKGGTASTTVTDARGRTTELLQYTDTARTASQKTTYTYGKYDEPKAVTDPDGNVWSYTFDSRGQKTVVDDPDQGEVHNTYDAAQVSAAKKQADADRIDRENKAAEKRQKKDTLFGNIKKGHWGAA